MLGRDYRGMTLGTLGVVAGLAAVSALAWARLPAGTRLPFHWNAAGRVDRWADAGTALGLPVLLAAGIGGVMAALPRLEPMQDRLAASAPLFRTGWACGLAVAVLVELMVAGPAFGLRLGRGAMPAGVGLTLVAIGNVLPKSRPGFFVGIRKPWTLTDAENWIATHRFGGKTYVAAGLAFVAAALLPPDGAQVMVGVAVALCLLPLPYSWWYWRRTLTAPASR